MTVFNCYIFNRNWHCIGYKEWKREKQSGMSREEEGKLLFGMIHSLNSFAERMWSGDGQQQVRFFKTSGYKCSYLETATGLKLILNTDPNATGTHDLLKSIYRVYVENVLKNPLIDVSETIESPQFFNKMDEVVQKHTAFV